MTISSAANEKVKAVRKLLQKKYRAETGLFVAEGENILSDMPESAAAQSFFATEKREAEAASLAEKFSVPFYVVDEAVMKTMTDTVTPSGLLAVVRTPAFKKADSDALFLDGVSDCGNLGTLIRTAASAGFENVYAVNCADVFAPKTIRATMGGIFRVNVMTADAESAVSELKKYDSVVMDMDGTDVFSLAVKKPVAVVLGSEAHGVSDCFRKAADHIASLSMANGMESLNVAVAGGLAMYVLKRRLNVKPCKG